MISQLNLMTKKDAAEVVNCIDEITAVVADGGEASINGLW